MLLLFCSNFCDLRYLCYWRCNIYIIEYSQQLAGITIIYAKAYDPINTNTTYSNRVFVTNYYDNNSKSQYALNFSYGIATVYEDIQTLTGRYLLDFIGEHHSYPLIMNYDPNPNIQYFDLTSILFTHKQEHADNMNTKLYTQKYVEYKKLILQTYC